MYTLVERGFRGHTTGLGNFLWQVFGICVTQWLLSKHVAAASLSSQVQGLARVNEWTLWQVCTDALQPTLKQNKVKQQKKQWPNSAFFFFFFKVALLLKHTSENRLSRRISECPPRQLHVTRIVGNVSPLVPQLAMFPSVKFFGRQNKQTQRIPRKQLSEFSLKHKNENAISPDKWGCHWCRLTQKKPVKRDTRILVSTCCNSSVPSASLPTPTCHMGLYRSSAS